MSKKSCMSDTRTTSPHSSCSPSTSNLSSSTNPQEELVNAEVAPLHSRTLLDDITYSDVLHHPHRPPRVLTVALHITPSVPAQFSLHVSTLTTRSHSSPLCYPEGSTRRGLYPVVVWKANVLGEASVGPRRQYMSWILCAACVFISAADPARDGYGLLMDQFCGSLPVKFTLGCGDLE